MHIPRVLLRDDKAWAEPPPCEVALERDAARHLIQVLRLKAGHRLRVFDGHGSEFDAVLIDASRHTPRLIIEANIYPDTTPKLLLELIIGVPKADAMDWIVQKSVELGIRSLRPLLLTRSRSHGEHRMIERRHEHWQAVIVSAAEQCGRNELPILHRPMTLTEMLSDLPPPSDRDIRVAAMLPAERLGISTETIQSSSSRAESKIESASLAAPSKNGPCPRTFETGIQIARAAVGPEGGIHPEEAQELVSVGEFQPASLGPRTLRCETAAVVLLDRLQVCFGDGANSDA
ncbi:MAG: RsmE family RNA methyltransferase [Thioalkalivibrionaceae bacterium]